jgi:hypothetical protein
MRVGTGGVRGANWRRDSGLLGASQRPLALYGCAWALKRPSAVAPLAGAEPRWETAHPRLLPVLQTLVVLAQLRCVQLLLQLVLFLRFQKGQKQNEGKTKGGEGPKSN